MQILVLYGTVGASPHIGEILPPCDFFLTVLSFFFSGTRPGRTAELIFTFYGSNDVFPCKGGATLGTHAACMQTACSLHRIVCSQHRIVDAQHAGVDALHFTASALG